MEERQSWGQSTLEMALVLPLFFLILLAASQLGHMVYVKNTLEQASREAVRTIATTNQRELALQTAEKVCSDLQKDDLQVAVIGGLNQVTDIGDPVTVKIIYSYGGMANIIQRIWRPIPIKSSSTMRMECVGNREIFP